MNPGCQGVSQTRDMNAIIAIHPYKHEGLWVFDDPRVGLVQEPFVSGADEIIERMVQGISGAQSGFTLLFSAAPFPGHQSTFEWRRSDMGGNWYTLRNWESKAGCVPRFSGTSRARRSESTRSSSQRLPNFVGAKYVCKRCGKEMFSLTQVVEDWDDIYCKACNPEAPPPIRQTPRQFRRRPRRIRPRSSTTAKTSHGASCTRQKRWLALSSPPAPRACTCQIVSGSSASNWFRTSDLPTTCSGCNRAGDDLAT